MCGDLRLSRTLTLNTPPSKCALTASKSGQELLQSRKDGIDLGDLLVILPGSPLLQSSERSSPLILLQLPCSHADEVR